MRCPTTYHNRRGGGFAKFLERPLQFLWANPALADKEEG